MIGCQLVIGKIEEVVLLIGCSSSILLCIKIACNPI